jgi:DNA-binding transcriptional regulator YhcF (GntR family)
MEKHPRQIIMRMLANAASYGKPCPTNAEIASAIGMKGTATAAGWIAKLEAEGRIEVARGHNARVVTILHSGQRTAGVVEKTHWRLVDDAKAQKAAEKTRRSKSQITAKTLPAAVPLTRVYREPCPKCGVRGDIGCAHSIAPWGVAA